LSVEAVQARLIWEEETTLPLKLVGIEGAVVSAAASVVAVAGADCAETFPPAS
jgi:hypothetical protein